MRSAPRPRSWLRLIARIVEALVIVTALGALLLWCSIPNTAPLATRNPSSTAFIDLRRADAAERGQAFKLQWEWRPLGKISRYLRAAVVYAEDWSFYTHDGVDWRAIEKAIDANLDKGSLAIGGSTITQQLAKNLYLSPSRSFARKVRELLIAYSLEDHLSKTRILELYLNVVEWGDGVFGAEAAAQHWFGHSAQSLLPAEAVRLAVALPNPFTRAPNLEGAALTKKSVRLIRYLRMQGLIDTEQERVALDSVGAPDQPTLPSRRRDKPEERASPPKPPATGSPLHGPARPAIEPAAPMPGSSTPGPSATQDPSPPRSSTPGSASAHDPAEGPVLRPE